MKLHYTKKLLRNLIFTSVLLTSLSSYALDPRLKYDKISSQNFDVIYDAKSYELAKIYLEEAERSHKILTEVFGISPKKTVVVLDDSLDLANGSAMRVPRPHVNIFVNPPTSLASIDYFSSWPRDVFLHEYAHILNMEPALGGWKPLRFIFGSIMTPNMLLPRWYLEGLAVEMESRYNEFGRLKSTDYDSLIRSLYLDSKWGTDNLSAINEVSIPYWPAGQRPYFYGALMWHELIQSKDITIVRKFNERYAKRFPWFLSEPMVEEFGKTYQSFLVDVYKKYGDLAQKQILKIQEQEITKGELILTHEGVFNHSPELSPDGEKLIFVSQNLDGDSVLYVMKRLGEKWIPLKALNPEEINFPIANVEKTEIQKASWFPTSNKIVFDSADAYDRTNYYYDLYTYDLEAGKTKRFTRGLRAREPAVSPDGNQVIYVKSGQGKTALYAVDANGKNETLIYAPASYERVSRPAYLSSKELVFSEKTNGKDRLHVLNLETKKVTRIMDYQGKFPVVTTKGITFTSNHNGVENLYLANPDFSSVKPLTNSLTRVVNGTLDPKANKIIYSELTGNGPQIKEAALDAKAKILPPVLHPIKQDFPTKISDEVPALNAKPKRYSAFPYMFPQYWLPWISAAEDGTIVSATLPGSDPTGFHQYILQGVYDSRPEKFSIYSAYLWSNSLGQTVFSANDYYKYYSSTKESNNSQLFSITHGFFIPGMSNDWKALLGYEYKNTSVLESGVTKNHYFNGPSAGITYSNMEQKAMAISPTGQMMTLKYTDYLSNSTKTDYDETFLKLAHYHKKWLPKKHVLALAVQGVYSEANRNILLGTTSTDTELILGTTSEGFLTRGYPIGEFIGYSIASGSVEYRFPIRERWEGPDSPAPYFIKRIHGGVFFESLTLKGLHYNENDNARRSDFGKYYSAAGVEFKVDTTLFYHAPVTIKLIGAYGFEKEANGGATTNLVLMAPEFF